MPRDIIIYQRCIFSNGESQRCEVKVNVRIIGDECNWRVDWGPGVTEIWM